MSRLIVKNLPKTVTEDKLRELFSQNGVITDIQLKYTKEGKFRKFGFIGFQNEHEAEQAITSLNNSFINTSKISVEKCALLGDESKPKSWSKYSADSTAFKKANLKRKASDVDEVSDKKNKISEKKKKKNDAKELLVKYKNDPMFKEFLKVHNKEDTIEELEKPILNDDTEQNIESAEELTEKIAEAPVSDMEYMNLLKKGVAKVEKQLKPKDQKKKKDFQLFTLKLIDLPYTTKKKDIKTFFQSNIPFSIRIPRQVKGIAFVGYKNEEKFKIALKKDKSFIKGKQIRVIHYVERKDTKNTEPDSKKSKWKSQEDALKNEEDIAESGRIFIRNLSYTTAEKDLEDLFTKYGSLAEVNLPIDTTSRQSKGFAFVTFVMPEHAVKAYTELDGSILHGRMMHLLPGKAKEATEEDKVNDSNYKDKKAANLKSKAGSSRNWNTLFLGQNAVAGVMADTYGLRKDDLIGPDAKGNAAMQLALGETELVLQTRNYLEQHGVVVDMFNSVPKTLSKTVLLVKNLPPKTEVEEIRKIFGEHGELGRVILPHSGITAIVEFLETSEARKAFLKLLYAKFKSVPLYLEWAPEGSLSDAKTIQVATDHSENSASKCDNSEEVNNEKDSVQEEESEDEIEPDTTLFVKNLNFITTDEELKKHFEGCGKLKYANVATKKDSTNPGAKLSRGYGFVQFYLKKSADKALKSLQQSVLDGKSLEIKRSERTTTTEEQKSTRKTTKLSKQNGSKILVRNVPFEAGSKDLLDLFKNFGHIKALRLPKKIDLERSNSHRGFAFVDYASAVDAKNAFETLSQSTHIFGRRLNLEWATAEETVEDIRNRTKKHFVQKEEVKSKNSVYNFD